MQFLEVTIQCNENNNNNGLPMVNGLPLALRSLPRVFSQVESAFE